MRVLDRLKLNRTPLVGSSGKSIKPGASPLQRVNQPGQVRLLVWSWSWSWIRLLAGKCGRVCAARCGADDRQ